MKVNSWILGAGVSWGLVCALATDLPVAATVIQMAMPWVWLAALVGFTTHSSSKRAAVLGAVALLAANLAYFFVRLIARLVATGQVDASDVRFVVFWSTMGLVVGPTSGALGRITSTQRGAVVGSTLLCAASIAEPIAWWSHVQKSTARSAYLVVAVLGVSLLVLRLADQPRRMLVALILSAIVAYPMAIALEAVLIATDQVSAPFRLV